MEFETIVVERPDPRVARIVMNRPEARNAQNLQMTYDLNSAFDAAVQDDAVKSSSRPAFAMRTARPAHCHYSSFPPRRLASACRTIRDWAADAPAILISATSGCRPMRGSATTATPWDKSKPSSIARLQPSAPRRSASPRRCSTARSTIPGCASNSAVRFRAHPSTAPAASAAATTATTATAAVAVHPLRGGMDRRVGGTRQDDGA
jgi:hypothetical protein